MPILPDVPPPAPVSPATSPAAALSPQQRQQLARDALAGQPITTLAQQHEVSRKFVYQQRHRADEALQQAFTPPAPDPDQLLFWLPVTKPWLRQLVLGLVLIGRSSLRGVGELLADLFDYPLSLGTVHHILQDAVAPARAVNGAYDLSGVRFGADDEIFQVGRPVLVGADVASTFCYLLSLEEHRDADTWGVRLLELCDRGFQPQAILADFGHGLRAGHALALPQVPCRGDVFHAVQDAPQIVRSLEHRAYQALETCNRLERQDATHQRRQGRAHRTAVNKLPHARAAAAQALTVAEEVAVLLRWLREDVLALNGLPYADRCALYDFVAEELHHRATHGPQLLEELVSCLRNHRSEVLAFAAALEDDLTRLAEAFAVPLATVRAVLETQVAAAHDPRRWQREAELRQQLRGRYYGLATAVSAVRQQTVRASSVVENLNSRLRTYFTLRRELGPDYLSLLQFFLNHRRFVRSEHAERVGRSPAELLTGQTQPHWLERLGYQRFRRS
jgi:hypothetical protein